MHRNFIRTLVLLGSALVATAAFADSIVIYNTGVDSSGNLLTGASTDPHYQLITSADPNFPGPDAIVTLHNQNFPLPGQWIPEDNNSISQWVSPRGNEVPGDTQGLYVYQITFDLTGLDPNTAMLMGQFSADNNSVIELNGNLVGPAATGFTSWTPFNISSDFVNGINTLDFLVTNTIPDKNFPNPTGLRVEITGTAFASVPEPATFAFVGLSLIGIAGARKWLGRNRKV